MASDRDRLVKVPGTSNLRDIGGYTGIDGKHVKWGIVYRSDALNEVDAADAAVFLQDSLHIHNTFDFRKEEEVSAKPYNFEGITRHWLPTGPNLGKDHSATGKPFTAEVMMDVMLRTYIIRIDELHEKFLPVLRFIIDEDVSAQNAILFHCTAGKDRTGWMTALILSALGVCEETIIDDFMLTNLYFKRPADAHKYLGLQRMDAATMEVLWTVNRKFLDVAFAHVKEKHGGMMPYLKEKMGLSDADISVLRQKLLE